MIIFYCLVAVPIPPHAFTFYEACMMFAKQDMFDGQELYGEWFVFFETTALNDMFEILDFGDKNFIMNSGSYFIFIVLTFVYLIIRLVVNRMTVLCAKYKWPRKLGIQVFNRSYV